MRKTAHNFTISIGLGRDILQEILNSHGVQGWNNWLHSINKMNMMTGKSPISINFDCSGANFRNTELDGLDLHGVNMSYGIFSHSSLYGACFSDVPFGDFFEADLRQASFANCNLTGTHFTESMIDGINWEGAFYNPEYPPIGLPDDVMGTLKRVGEDEEDHISAHIPVTDDETTAIVYFVTVELADNHE